MRVDLHIHTHFSDGRYSPEEVVSQAIAGCLDLIAIADHDTLDGYPEAIQAAQGKIQIPQAVECSTHFGGEEIHILAYFPETVGSTFLQFLQKTQVERKLRIIRTLEQLQEICQIQIPYQAVIEKAHTGNLSMSHLAAVMVEMGITTSFREAFRQFLSSQRQIAPLPTPQACQVISLIQAQGGLSFWAHPRRVTFAPFLPAFVQAGLVGIEAFGSWPRSTARYYRRAAEAQGLMVSGGSDWHGHRLYPRLGEFAVEDTRLFQLLRHFPFIQR